LRYLAGIADRFAGAGKWSRAAGYYRQMLLQVADEGVAAACVNAYLKMSPPDTKEAESVLTATAGLSVEKSWRLLIARAALRKQQGKDGPMRADMISALEVA